MMDGGVDVSRHPGGAGDLAVRLASSLLCRRWPDLG